VTRWRTAALTAGLAGVVSVVFANNSRDILRARLTGYEEVPTLSSSGEAKLFARINEDETAVEWKLSYANLESTVTQAHIHFSARAISGPVVVFFCTNLGNGPAGTQACPPAPATISGTFTAADVTGGAAAQGLEAGNLAELIAGIRAGATYANVHSVNRPAGEVRGQIAADDDHDGQGHDHR
jgi:CHRD domain